MAHHRIPPAMGRFYPPGVPKSIEYPEMPLYGFLENSARKFPGRVGAHYLGEGVTYRALWGKALNFAAHLIKLGVERGDRVGLLMANTPQYIVAFNGALAAGAVVVTINPLNPVEEIGRELAETECKALVVLDRLLGKLPKGYPGKVIVAEAAEYAPPHMRLVSSIAFRGERPADALRFDALTRGAKGKPAAVSPREDLAAILYTSGTTGQPKGVMLTHYALAANALQSYYWLRGWGYSAKPQPAGWPLILCAVPFFHSYGLNIMNEAISFGCTLVLIPDPRAEAILEAVQRHRVTHMPLIPRFVSDILAHPKLGSYDLTSVTTANSGGASIRPELMRRFEEITGANFYQGYGLTEAGPATHATPIEGRRNYESPGMAYPDTEVKVVDLQVSDVEVPPGKEGELLVRGPQIMKGYWRAPEETAHALEGGWLHTGDVARVDEDGWLYVVGRKADRIVAAGHTVWPTMVEEALLTSTDVELAVAVGAPDPLRCNTDIQALVVLKKDAVREGAEARLIELCRAKLQPYEVPGRIDVVESLPMTNMGKVDRVAVEAEIKRRVQRAMDDYAREHAPQKS
jgi:long-chain acyl-CoA synthetase